jgi:hypothetical protein
LGIDDFPNGEAYKSGTNYLRLDIARLFIRQIIALGGEQEYVPPDGLTLAGKHDYLTASHHHRADRRH